jgi:hypothetical protein
MAVLLGVLLRGCALLCLIDAVMVVAASPNGPVAFAQDAFIGG